MEVAETPSEFQIRNSNTYSLHAQVSRAGGIPRILPVAPPGRGPVTTLAWSADGTRLAIGTENGFAAIVDFARRAG